MTWACRGGGQTKSFGRFSVGHLPTLTSGSTRYVLRFAPEGRRHARNSA